MNNPDFCTAVKVALDVNVFTIVVTLPDVFAESALALAKPPVEISPEPALKSVSVADGDVLSCDNPTNLQPCPPADVFV